jgi:hypothetical protein
VGAPRPRGPPPRPDAHPCDGTDIRDGDDSAQSEALRRLLARVLAGRGAQVGPEHVSVRADGLPQFSILLGAATGQPRHTHACLEAAFRDGAISSMEGANRAIAGAVQQWGGRTRVTMRVFDIETSEVLDAALADADGADDAATEAAASEAAAQLDLSF